MLREAWQEIRFKKRQNKGDDEEAAAGDTAQSNNRQKALDLNHVQGAFWILLLGALVATGAFLGELVVGPGAGGPDGFLDRIG